MVTILKCGFSGANLGKNKGCEKAPDKVVEELSNSIYLNEKGTKTQFKIRDIQVNNSNIEETNEKIHSTIKDELDKNKMLNLKDLTYVKNQNIFNKTINEKLVLIGGDHSITYSSYKAFTERFLGQNNGLIVFDAHADCVNNFDTPTHEDYLRTLIDKRILDPKNVILVGLRNIDGIEMEYLKMKKIKYFDMKKIFLDGIQETTDTITELANYFDNIYISIDIDAVDPSFAPGTGYLEPAGFSSREFLYMLQRMFLLKKIKMIDLVEINPDKDLNDITIRLGAKIINEI